MAVFGIAFVIIGLNITYHYIFTFIIFFCLVPSPLARQYIYVMILKTNIPNK